jgi:hypothetical protein
VQIAARGAAVCEQDTLGFSIINELLVRRGVCRLYILFG